MDGKDEDKLVEQYKIVMKTILRNRVESYVSFPVMDVIFLYVALFIMYITPAWKHQLSL